MSDDSFKLAAPVVTVETPQGKPDKRKVIVKTDRGERTLWTFTHDKSDPPQPHPWMAGIAQSSVTGEVVVFSGFRSRGNKPNERTGKKPWFFNITKAEPFDANRHADVPRHLIVPDDPAEQTPAQGGGVGPTGWGQPATTPTSGSGWGAPTGESGGGSNPPGQTAPQGAGRPSAQLDPVQGRRMAAVDAARHAVTVLATVHGAVFLPPPPDDPAEHMAWLTDKAWKLSSVVERVADRIMGEGNA